MRDIQLNFHRKLTFSIDGIVSIGEISIPKIVFLPERQKWGCHWSISFIKLDPSQYIIGDDPMEALTMTLECVSSLLRDSGIPNLKVWWQFEGDNGGIFSFSK
jgi:hypothetical protein